MGKLFYVILLTVVTVVANAQSVDIRWTGSDDKNSDRAHVLDVLFEKTGVRFYERDFHLQERVTLATSEYELWLQQIGGVPVQGRSLRIWKDRESGETVQVEALLDSPIELQQWPILSFMQRRGVTPYSVTQQLSSQATMSVIRDHVLNHRDDRQIRDIQWKDYWRGSQLVRDVKVRGRRGNHRLVLSLPDGRVLLSSYSEFPQLAAKYPAKVYPIYEQSFDGRMQERIDVWIDRVAASIPAGGEDPYAALRNRRYLTNAYDPVLATLPEYWERGFWSTAELKSRANAIAREFPQTPNTFATGLLLQGQFVTVNIHPDAATKFTGISFPLTVSSRFLPRWVETVADGQTVWEVVPSGAILGKPAFGREEFLSRPADRHPQHDPVTYINSGFDEVQVYYAVDRLMVEMHGMGFTDPEISTRPFHAFLFDPDIGMRDNAYYTDDTINFTTYSPEAQNYARDNPTIWHELGHGMMDRLMGDYLVLADTGGLSEGMADFLAQLIVEKVTGGATFDGKDEFRINNKIGFHLTNEVHDDGEAYGGTMYDFLRKSIETFGADGVVKVTDLTLEAMRLARNHPRLTAQEWFNHMMYADHRASVHREAGELGALLHEALAGRNYRFDGGAPADFLVKNGGAELTSHGPGSRDNPIEVLINGDDLAAYQLSAELKSTDTYEFKYPVTLKVQYEGGPLQGAIDWVGDEKGFESIELPTEGTTVQFQVTARGTCERINREDGSCVDFVYLNVFNHGDTHPVAKKRFYLRIKTQE